MREHLLPSLWTNRSLSREVKVPAQTVSFSITVRELSIFADESGTEADTSGYYLLTLVLHDQSEDVTGPISDYESALRIRGLTDIPMHSSPLLRGNEDYENLDVALRLKYLLPSMRLLCGSRFITGLSCLNERPRLDWRLCKRFCQRHCVVSYGRTLSGC